MDGAAYRRASVFDGDSDSADVFDCQWAGVWNYCLGGAASGSGEAEPEGLAAVYSGGTVPGAVFVSFGELRDAVKGEDRTNQPPKGEGMITGQIFVKPLINKV